MRARPANAIASRRFDAGPASDLELVALRMRRFAQLTGTGFAQPNRNGARTSGKFPAAAAADRIDVLDRSSASAVTDLGRSDPRSRARRGQRALVHHHAEHEHGEDYRDDEVRSSRKPLQRKGEMRDAPQTTGVPRGGQARAARFARAKRVSRRSRSRSFQGARCSRAGAHT